MSKELLEIAELFKAHLENHGDEKSMMYRQVVDVLEKSKQQSIPSDEPNVITPKFKHVSGTFDLNNDKLICVVSRKHSEVDLCFTGNMHIAFARVKIYGSHLLKDAKETFEDAKKLGETICDRFNNAIHARKHSGVSNHPTDTSTALKRIERYINSLRHIQRPTQSDKTYLMAFEQLKEDLLKQQPTVFDEELLKAIRVLELNLKVGSGNERLENKPQPHQIAEATRVVLARLKSKITNYKQSERIGVNVDSLQKLLQSFRIDLMDDGHTDDDPIIEQYDHFKDDVIRLFITSNVVMQNKQSEPLTEVGEYTKKLSPHEAKIFYDGFSLGGKTALTKHSVNSECKHENEN